MWNPWTDGRMAHGFHVPAAGHFAVKLRAGGQDAASLGPHVVVKVDGNAVMSRDVRTDGLHAYRGDFHADAEGWHWVVVKFTNDAVRQGDDRNLYVDYVRSVAD